VGIRRASEIELTGRSRPGRIDPERARALDMLVATTRINDVNGHLALFEPSSMNGGSLW